MAEMVFQYDIKTSAPNKDAEAMVKTIRDKLPSEYRMMEKVEIKELYFGIKAAVIQIVCDAADGSLQDKLENFLTQLEETGEFELSFASRL